MQGVTTTYCMKHDTLEIVDAVTEVSTFVVYEGAVKTNRRACMVRGFTEAGCRVHFIGGPTWSL